MYGIVRSTGASGTPWGRQVRQLLCLAQLVPLPQFLPPVEPPVFQCPRRPNLGREGRPIGLKANHFQISMPRGYVHHYDVNIQPDKCPRKVNRDY
ncbi:hypothetical protein NQ318_013318 [Aromia moschata]|uniref:Protein argonaute N-terminal domain-containing protein n=1 Tax=Aromia moschata TaxID=1265417 RepID=A0AAV8XYG3_9CUCU|nr:hypothetical protein NQ318_013318 [Aromia moschata]